MAEQSEQLGQAPFVQGEAPPQPDQLLSTARTLPVDDQDNDNEDHAEAGGAGEVENDPTPRGRRESRRDNELDPRHRVRKQSRDVEAALDGSNISSSSSSSSSSAASSPASTATSASTAAAVLAGTAALRALPAGRKTTRTLATTAPLPSSTVKAGRYVRNFGLFFLSVGLLTLGAAILSHTLLPEWRDKKALRALVVDSAEHPGYAAWADPSSPGAQGGGDSFVYQQFYFFHLVNPTGFLQGKKPVYLEKGPYTFQQKKKKVEVEFSEDGTLVSYVTLVQNEYMPVRFE